MSLNTAVARVRDAIASYRRYGWQPSTINSDKFQTIASKLIVSTRDNQLYIGPNDTATPPPIEAIPVAAPIRVNLDNITDVLRFDLLTCFAKLRAAQLIPPVIITGQTTLAFDTKALSQVADIGIAYGEQNFTIV